MNRRILYTGLISMSLLLYGIASCTSDEFRLIPSQEEEEEETRPPVTVMTKSDVNLSEPEDSIATVRWIVLSPAGEVLFNEIKNAAEINALPDANAGKAGKQVEISFTALLTTHYAGFFMIANELSTWNLGSYTVGSTVSSETLKGKVLTYSNNSLMQVGTLIPMAGIYEHLYIAADGKTYKVANDPSTKQNPGDIERLYARVSLTIDADTANLLNKDPLDIKSLRVMRMPKQSYLAPLLYTGTDFVDGGYVPIITSGPAKNYTAYNPLTKGNSFDGDFSFYIPEYILSDTSKYTYMKAVVELRGGLDSLEYRIAIGDSVADGNNAWML
ncbi:MAG: hypothetical protein LBQ73_02345, partial [Tannerellaceae bacterium]|nr:hypothetical protein [Tannerellaceae bacterium]